MIVLLPTSAASRWSFTRTRHFRRSIPRKQPFNESIEHATAMAGRSSLRRCRPFAPPICADTRRQPSAPTFGSGSTSAAARLVDTYRERAAMDLLRVGLCVASRLGPGPPRSPGTRRTPNAWGGGLGRARSSSRMATPIPRIALVFSDSHKDARTSTSATPGPRTGGSATSTRSRDWATRCAIIAAERTSSSGWPVPVVILLLASLRYGWRHGSCPRTSRSLNGGVNHGSVWYYFGQIAID